MAEDKDTAEKVHSTFLTDEEKAKIQKDVEKEYEAEKKKKMMADYKASLMAEAKKKELFSNAKEGERIDGLVSVFIDLPSVAECVRLDGVAYYPGRTYNVTPGVRALILEIMGRGFQHEDTLNGKTSVENMYRKKNTSKLQQ